ncbi:MAG: hypothetical protein P1Q69_16035, partial [Candidatus Thorarchaeota archaeon]|nr:hypothetical protein [Candidatus Thorarchaeota archaeon]
LSAMASPNYVMAQDGLDINSLLESLLTDGAEVVFANVDDQGIPSVIYGQLGVPSTDLNLENAMYDGCIAMALVSTHGEFLNFVLELLASDGLGDGDGGEGGFALAQDGGGFDVNSILDMVGTEFNLLINVFVNVDEATSTSRMSQIMTHLTSSFGFSFINLLNLRIDQDFFPDDANITLPFDSIDIYIQQETHEFSLAVDAMLDLMNGDGFLEAIDRTKFTNADASAAGLIAIPDMGEVVELISSISGDSGGGEFLPSAVYQLAQTPFDNITGPIALAAAGYIGGQYLDTSSTSLHVEDLLGVTGTISPLPSANSLIVTMLPDNVNITSISPDVPGQSFFNASEGNTVFWNATALGTQSDYVINFEEGEFPPKITIDRTFSPASETIGPGGSTTVTVTVTNEGTEAISNLTLTDTSFASTYSSVTVTGTTSNTYATLAGGDSVTISYEVTFANEGGYLFAPAELTYEYDGGSYFKDSIRQGFTVVTDVAGLLTEAILSGMPYTGIALGVVGLVGIYAIMGLRKGASSAYQV